MTAPHVTKHAIERYRERVANVSDDLARIALASPAVAAAIRIGAHYVKLGSGHRIVLDRNRVATVLCKKHSLGCMSRDADQRRSERDGY